MHSNIEKLKKKLASYLLLIPTNGNSKNSQLYSFAFAVEKFDILSLVDKLQSKELIYFYWNLPFEEEEFLGFLPLLEINEPITNGIEFSNSNLEKLQNSFISNWTELDLRNVPFVMGGIKFASDEKSEVWKDFGDSDWFIPSITLLKQNNKFYIIYNFFVDGKSADSLLEDFDTKIKKLELTQTVNNAEVYDDSVIDFTSTNSHADWDKMVTKGLDKIRDKELQKVVLSREVKITLNEKPIISNLVSKLSSKYPKCYSFAFSKNQSTFIGASPEKFVKFDNNNIEIDALAGSVKRGADEAEDLELEKYLLESEKNLNEQKAVVTFIKNLLVDISEEVIINELPIIRKLPNIQHLWTPIKARLKEGCTLFDVLRTLNPTPAICGTPWNVAHKNILELESHDRGLYSGNVGWFNFDGDGELAVAIRSSLIKEKTLFAYAGCGIVEGSKSQLEFEESEIKLKPILSLFVDEKVYQS
ncbi:MAG: isochorismate synthase [Ignavibacteriae bacterium]|nr:isochorismate synthase [Ignavibacteriota bacterium]